MDKNVTVVMSAYNHDEYVRQTIESVLNQTYKGIYFIAIDDASTDGTKDILIEYGDIIDEVHLYDVNSGFSRAVPYIMEAKTKYTALINSDDYWEIDKIEKQVGYLEAHPECAACFTLCKEIDDNGDILSTKMFDADNRSKEEWMQYFWLNSNCLAHPSILIRTEIYQELFLNRVPGIRQLGDFYKWLDLIQKYEIYILQERLTTFRYHSSKKSINVSGNTKNNVIRDFIEQCYLWNKTMKSMEDDYFIKAFSKYMVNQNARTKEEIACEKYFILVMSPVIGIQQASYQYYYDTFSDEKNLRILQEKYGYFPKDFIKKQEEIGINKLLKVIKYD